MNTLKQTENSGEYEVLPRFWHLVLCWWHQEQPRVFPWFLKLWTVGEIWCSI